MIETGPWSGKKELPKLLPLDTEETGFSTELDVWGASQAVAGWARDHNIPYSIPDIRTVRRIHSKEYTTENAAPIEGIYQAHNMEELSTWLTSSTDPKVLKKPFGVAGNGHFLVSDETKPEQISRFCRTEWSHGRPIIGEFWMTRVLDFSSQWQLTPDGAIHLIGTASIENNARGGYLRSIVGKQTAIHQKYGLFLEEHLAAARGLLTKISAEGYHGPIGVDAFIYRVDDTLKLRPIVEVNARQTMSLVALKFAARWFPEQTVSLQYAPCATGTSGLLPTHLNEAVFRRQLTFTCT